jgi:hypothetical protein
MRSRLVPQVRVLLLHANLGPLHRSGVDYLDCDVEVTAVMIHTPLRFS